MHKAVLGPQHRSVPELGFFVVVVANIENP